MTRILHLIPDLGLGGAQRVLCSFAAGMDPARYRLEVVYWGEADDLRKELENLGVGVVCLKGVGHSLRRLAVALGKHLRHARPDIVHTHLFDADLIGTIVARALGIRRCYSTVHSSTFFSDRRHRWRYRGLALMVRRFFAVSHAIETVLVRRCRVPASKVQVVMNGVDTAYFAPAAVRADRAAGWPVIGVLARLDPLKGIGILLEAIAQSRSDFPDVRLLVGGAGEEQESLEQQARRLGIADRVVFTGPVYETRGFYGRLDLFVLPSLDEGFGLVILEAMAMGLPVIGTRVGGIPELLAHGHNGWLVEPGDPRGIAEGIRALWSDPALRTRLAVEARRTAVGFTIGRTTGQLQAEYARVP